jgi:hypothetical protein
MQAARRLSKTETNTAAAIAEWVRGRIVNLRVLIVGKASTDTLVQFNGHPAPAVMTCGVLQHGGSLPPWFAAAF